jgi:uncharacterized protein YdhG (YjbR/CyaY superfamily)
MNKRAARQVKPRAKAAGSPIVEYIAQAPPATRSILRKIRAIVRTEAPGAEERISYRIPAFFNGGAIIYFAPFKHHVGVFPPVKGDAALEKALAKYRGEKGNLRFPLDEPMPYPLIRRVVRARLKALRAKQATAKRRWQGLPTELIPDP